MRVIRAAFFHQQQDAIASFLCLEGGGAKVQAFYCWKPPAFSRAFFALFLVILLKVFVKKRLNMGRG